MSAATRRERQRVTNRENILRAALEIAEREGWPAVTIRRIADEIEYTSPIIYQHFRNKEAAFQALMEQGYAQLRDDMERAVRAALPEERPLKMALAYLRFAREQPRLYELMHGLGGVVLDGSARHAAASGVVALTAGVLEEWAALHHTRLPDPLAACETAWGILHGMATLGMLPDIGFERSERLAVDALSALLSSLKANT